MWIVKFRHPDTDIALQVFKKVEKQLPQLTTLDLQYVSPSLLKARSLDLAVPGELLDHLLITYVDHRN